MNKARCIKFMYPHAEAGRDYMVMDDGGGQKIIMWKLPQPVPTDAELEAVWPDAEKQDIYNQAHDARRQAYIEEADVLAYKVLRGEATRKQYKEKIAEIKARYPYPEGYE